MKTFREEDLSSYVLGEASSETRQLIEEAIKKDPALKTEIEQLAAFTKTLGLEMKKEEEPSLSPAQKSALEKKLKKRFSFFRLTLIATPVAATIAILIIVGVPNFQKFQSRSQPVVIVEETQVSAAPKSVPTTPEVESLAPANRKKNEGTAVYMDQSQTLIVGGLATQGAAIARSRGDSLNSMERMEMKGHNAPSLLADKRVTDDESDVALGKHSTTTFNTEAYRHLVENAFKRVGDEPFSTFSIDVDTAGYSVLRRFVSHGSLPPPESVRIEELLNYFPYDYQAPKNSEPFAVNMEMVKAPWKSEHKLLRVGLKAKDVDWSKRPLSNLVFLLDVSGSMNDPNKLPLVKSALKMLIENLGENDKVAMVVYAGASGLALPSTRASDKAAIMAALDRLEAGGSTNGGAGIQLAYKIAEENFIPGGINRVLLATDGDFNVGTTSESDLVTLIEKKAKSKVFLTVMGFGMGNYKDSLLEQIANKGNGAYAYIDNSREARKVLVEQAGGSLITIAKDVKIQIEFNPARVAGYRLIGYENRLLNKEDFNDDTKDAGEIGAGHTVTALYEIVPKGKTVPGSNVDELRYQKTATPNKVAKESGEALTVKLRYKMPEGDVSQLMSISLPDNEQDFSDASNDLKFQAGVAQFGMLLRDSKHKSSSSFESALKLLRDSASRNGKVDPYRQEFIEIVEKVQVLKKGEKQ